MFHVSVAVSCFCFLLFCFVVALLLVFIQLTPIPAMACIEGLSWGMDLSSVERHLGVSLNPADEEASRGLYEI